MWQCPLCKYPLSLISPTSQCENGHSFDMAKAGYVNLFPVQFKNSKNPGDDKAMVRARREFHSKHGYLPLKQKMVALLADNAPVSDVFRVYDAGCGEGSYLYHIVEGLNDKNINTSGAGSDIAKIAVELAAKAYKSLQFVVASSFDLPLQDATQHAVIQVFAPGDSKEYARVLEPDGLLITVDPAPDHLFELKALIYDQPQQHSVGAGERDGFSLLSDEALSYALTFDSREQVTDLVKMTPYYWKLPEGKIDSIISSLKKVTVDFQIRLYKRNA